MAGLSGRWPYRSEVPRDPDKNIEYRKRLIAQAQADTRVAVQLVAAAIQDVFFYIESFCLTYDPRVRPAQIPWVLYPYQHDLIQLCVDCIESGEDLVLPKSRDMGVSWCILAVFEWYWHLRDLCTFLLVSRKEELIDKAGDPKALMWKIDFIHRTQPAFMRPAMGKRTSLHMENGRTGSTIDGESTTGDVARGDRRTAIMLDEFAFVDEAGRVDAATADATECRIIPSTPNGPVGTFYRMAHNTTVKRMRLHWTLHPKKAAGLYRDEKGKPRSPWYDKQCERRANPVSIARELDIDFGGSQQRWFDMDVVRKYEVEFAREPFELVDIVDGQAVKRPNADIALWDNPDASGKLRTARYVIGVDVAAGTGASNSCLSAWSSDRREKVAEFAHPRMRPEEFAEFTFKVGRWLGDALIVFESGGPGFQFGNKLFELGYRNVYYHENRTSLKRASAAVAGYPTNREGKLALLSNYRDALNRRTMKNPSRLALAECEHYVYTPAGGVEHSSAIHMTDPSGAKRNHGDRAVADALAVYVLGPLRVPRPADGDHDPENPPVGSLAWRRQLRAERKAKVVAF